MPYNRINKTIKAQQYACSNNHYKDIISYLV